MRVLWPLFALGVSGVSACIDPKEVPRLDVSPEVRKICSGLPVPASRRFRMALTADEAIAIAKNNWLRRGVRTDIYRPFTAVYNRGLWEVDSPSTNKGLLRATICHENGFLLQSTELIEVHERTRPPSGGFVPDATAAERVATAVWPALFSRPLHLGQVSWNDDEWIVFTAESRLRIRSDTGALTAAGNKPPLIRDEQTAIRLAEALAITRYGRHVLEQRPFQVATRDDIWLIESTFPLDRDAGGTAHLGISKSDGGVIWMFHTK